MNSNDPGEGDKGEKGDAKTSSEEPNSDSETDRPQSKTDRPQSKTDRPQSKTERPQSKAESQSSKEDIPKADIEGQVETRPSSTTSTTEKNNAADPAKSIAQTPAGSRVPSARKSSARSRPASGRSIKSEDRPRSKPDPTSPRIDISTPKETSVMKLDLPKEDDTKSGPYTARSSVRNVPCEMCPQLEDSKTSKAEFVCTSCVERYCVRCSKRHIETPVFVNHIVVPMEPTDEDEIQDLVDFPCRTHKSRFLGYFCHGCQQAVCGMCITFDHGGKHHRLEPIGRLDSNKKILLLRYEKALNKDLQRKNKTEPKEVKVRPVAQLYWKSEIDKESENFKEERHQLYGPADVTFLPDGQVVLVNRWSNCVQRFDQDGSISDIVLSDVGPIRLCSTADDRVAVVDDYAGKVKIIGLDEISREARADYSKAKALQKRSQERDKEKENNKDQSKAEGQSNGEEQNGFNDREATGHDQDTKDPEQNQSERTAGPDKDDEGDGGENTATEPGTKVKDATENESLDSSSLKVTREDTLSHSFVTKWKPAGVKRPWAIAVNKFNQWIVSDYEQYVRATVNIYHPDYEMIRSFGGHGEREDQFEWPNYITCDSKARIIVSDYWDHSVKIFDSRGNFQKKVGKGWGKKDGYITYPKGVCVDDEDNIIVVDSGNMRITEFSSDGDFKRYILTAEDGLLDVEGIAFLKIKDDEDGKDLHRETLGEIPNKDSQTKRSQTSKSPLSDEGSGSSAAVRRLAVTMSKGRQYSALLIYNLVLPSDS